MKQITGLSKQPRMERSAIRVLRVTSPRILLRFIRGYAFYTRYTCRAAPYA